MLSIIDLKRQIKTKTLNSLYVFTGEELGLLYDYVNSMGNVCKSHSLSSIWPRLNTKSVTSDRIVYVVKDDDEVIQKEKMWDRIKAYSGKNTVVLVYAGVKPSTKFLNSFDEYVVKFDRMTSLQLVAVAKKKCPYMKPEDLEYLVERCDNDLIRINNELDKIDRLHDLNMIKDYRKTIDNIVVKPLEFSTFLFTGAVLRHEPGQAVRLLHLAPGDPDCSPLGLLTLLYNNFRDAAVCLGYEGEKDIEAKTGINQYKAKSLLRDINYKPSECLKAMRIIQFSESSVKYGKLKDWEALEYAVLAILNIWR